MPSTLMISSSPILSFRVMTPDGGWLLLQINSIGARSSIHREP
jgi:hypothetical protein